jgi:hypothetical protein
VYRTIASSRFGYARQGANGMGQSAAHMRGPDFEEGALPALQGYSITNRIAFRSN